MVRRKEGIDPHSRKIEIEHVIGEQTLTQILTYPQLRPCKNIYQLKLTLLGADLPVWRRIQLESISI